MSILTFYNGHIMTWNIAQAKQQFSEVVRLSAKEPQAIYNRDKPVAVLINADEFKAFRQWRAGQHEPTLAAQFAESRLALQQAGVDALQIPARGCPTPECLCADVGGRATAQVASLQLKAGHATGGHQYLE